MTNPLLDSMKWRYAVKQFDPRKKLDASKVEELLETLRLCPSSFGMQPWHFILVEDKGLRESLMRASYDQKQVIDASHLVVFCRLDKIDDAWADRYLHSIALQRSIEFHKLESFGDVMKKFLRAKSEEERAIWMEEQVYIALGFFLSACAIEGIDTCPIGGFQKRLYDQILGLGEKGLKSVVVCPMGFRAGTDKYWQLEKVRFESEKVITRI